MVDSYATYNVYVLSTANDFIVWQKPMMKLLPGAQAGCIGPTCNLIN